jgi:hypothetical protein
VCAMAAPVESRTAKFRRSMFTGEHRAIPADRLKPLCSVSRCKFYRRKGVINHTVRCYFSMSTNVQ